jgi:hypothetical protein
LAFAPHDRTLVSAADATVLLWDLANLLDE